MKDKFTFGVWGNIPRLWVFEHFTKKDLHRLPKDKWYKNTLKPPELDFFGEGLPLTLYYNKKSNLTNLFNYCNKFKCTI